MTGCRAIKGETINILNHDWVNNSTRSLPHDNYVISNISITIDYLFEFIPEIRHVNNSFEFIN